MSEFEAVGPETNTPVNPYSLLEAVNDSSDEAHVGWGVFLALMVYLMVAVAGVTHRDLLLETPVELPILQVRIQLAQFFTFAPIVLVLLHMGLIAQLVLLSRKVLEFDHSIRLLEATEKRNHPLRLELHNFFFVQAVAGPDRSRVLGSFLHALSWLTIVILPVVLILFIQVSFLPYHSVGITWIHRIVLIVDIMMLISIGIFLSRAETSFFRALLRASSSNPVTVSLTTIVMAMVALFSFFSATVPDEFLDRLTHKVLRRNMGAGATEGFLIPFLKSREDGTLFGIFRRNLVVSDTDLVVDKDVTPGEPSLKLRGRDLRHAQLERSDLHQADFTSALLDHAKLAGADLRGVLLQCPDLGATRLERAGSRSLCPSAIGADFSKARLEDAKLSGTNLSGAVFAYARLEGADLTDATLVGVDFSNAKLDRAEMGGGINAQGASFLLASLVGADLTGAKLLGADFTYSQMQGAVLNQARLEGAKLRNVDLEGASLAEANLQGANLAGARIDGADLHGSWIWQTEAANADASGVTDVAEPTLRPLDGNELAALKSDVQAIGEERVRGYVGDSLEPLAVKEEKAKWATGPAHAYWQGMITAAPAAVPGYQARLTEYLVKLACKPRASAGNVATGLARRALSPQFRGDMVLFYDRLKADDCPASKTVSPRALKDLAAAADQLRK